MKYVIIFSCLETLSVPWQFSRKMRSKDQDVLHCYFVKWFTYKKKLSGTNLYASLTKGPSPLTSNILRTPIIKKIFNDIPILDLSINVGFKSHNLWTITISSRTSSWTWILKELMADYVASFVLPTYIP